MLNTSVNMGISCVPIFLSLRSGYFGSFFPFIFYFQLFPSEPDLRLREKPKRHAAHTHMGVDGVENSKISAQLYLTPV